MKNPSPAGGQHQLPRRGREPLTAASVWRCEQCELGANWDRWPSLGWRHSEGQEVEKDLAKEHRLGHKMLNVGRPRP